MRAFAVVVVGALSACVSESRGNVAADGVADVGPTTSEETSTPETAEETSAPDATVPEETQVEDVAEDTTVAPDVEPEVVVDCPTATITCEQDDIVFPKTRIYCSGADSFGGDGHIAEYQWSVRQPSGSKEIVQNLVAESDIAFDANVVGKYALVLDVVDGAGVKSCEAAEHPFEVTPSDALYIELTWSTPGDEDETDIGLTPGGESVGSDLDLHVLHPEGKNYFNEDYDCYASHCDFDWGSESDQDDPRSVRIDNDGAGPESVGFSLGEIGVAYKVGVHYWSDNGYGPALATLRVYVGGDLAYAKDEVQLLDEDMWTVGTIGWPSGEVTGTGGATPQIEHHYVIPN